eukprot:g47158.t1
MESGNQGDSNDDDQRDGRVGGSESDSGADADPERRFQLVERAVRKWAEDYSQEGKVGNQKDKTDSSRLLIKDVKVAVGSGVQSERLLRVEGQQGSLIGIGSPWLQQLPIDQLRQLSKPMIGASQQKDGRFVKSHASETRQS